MHIALLLDSVTAMREGRFGDAAVYKAIALTAAPYPEAMIAVKALGEPLPDFAELTSTPMPDGSLGDSYAAFLSRHGIAPLAISPRVRQQIAPLNLVAARYVVIHDVLHVLLGFDTSRAGELAVWSFVAEQRYSRSYERAAACARVLYTLAELSARIELKRQRDRAIELAHESTCLIGKPLERYWHLPLAEVRRELGIRSACDTL